MAERIFGRKESYEKYLLVERRDFGLNIKEFKQQYLLVLEASEPQVVAENLELRK